MKKICNLLTGEVVITSANVDNKKGYGPGYLIIKDLLKTMDASINIESKRGEGVNSGDNDGEVSFFWH